MKTGRIAMATLGVGAALTLGAWTLSAAAVPLPADPISIPIIAPSETAIADPRGTPASDPARAVADAEARLQAINSRLQTLTVDQAPTLSPTVAPTPAAHTPAAPTSAVVTPGEEGHGAEDHEAEAQDD